MKKLIGISLLSAAGLFAQATTPAPATPPAAGSNAPATKSGKAHKHHHNKKNKTGAATGSTAATPAPAAPTQGK